MKRIIVILGLLVFGCVGTALAQDEAPAAGLTVAESALGKNVVERELQDPGNAFAIGERVYLWCHLVGGTPGETVHHVWFHEGVEIQDIELPVGGERWRTWSYKTLFAGMVGNWRVDIRDAEGNTLASHAFEAVE